MTATTQPIEQIRLVSRPCHKATFAIDPIDRDANDGTCDCGAHWSATSGQDIEEWYLVHLPPMPDFQVARRIADVQEWVASSPDFGDKDALAGHIGRGRARAELLLEAIGAAGPAF